MSCKMAHKRKVLAKKFGRVLVRHVFDVDSESLFKKRSGTGKNQVNTVVHGVASKSGSGESVLARLQKMDAKDGGNRVETLLAAQ
ncbi:hypothetical protein [Enterovibrio norvegicus]|uniref:hypothetical protein n=1 Tax=Enterovibrio norvegicus TaxID=188144 RepID=UPI00352D0EB0